MAVITARACEVVLSGAAEVQWLDQDGRRLAVSVGSSSIVAHSVDLEHGSVTLRVSPDGQPDVRTDLIHGVVTGCCASLLFSASAESMSAAARVDTGESTQDEPTDIARAAEPSFQFIDLTGGSSDVRTPLPVATSGDRSGHAASQHSTSGPTVPAIECSAGHVNHPDARYCVVCGRGFAQGATLIVRQLERPPLGVLVVADGAAYSVDGGYVIGRDPHNDPSVAGGARPLVLDDQDMSISRVHAELQIRDWDLLVLDRGSRNGTFVQPRGAATWTAVGSDPVKVPPGATLAVGDQTIVFESHHEAAVG